MCVVWKAEGGVWNQPVACSIIIPCHRGCRHWCPGSQVHRYIMVVMNSAYVFSLALRGVLMVFT